MIATGMLTLVCGVIAGQFHHALGVAPILGAILCAACFLRPRDLFIVGLGGILIRDAVMGLSPFTAVRLAGIALVVTAVVALRVRPTLRSLLIGLLVSSPIFHLALAAGDWATGTCGIWPRSPQGLQQAVVSALPYFQRSFVGDVLFASLFLGAYTLAAYTVLGWRTSRGGSAV
ncbi:MAG: hypothetical protein HYZ95_01425 [Candidatus Omnitrophica bacterium]|nr:hypothetical protein [Candidatus Omnitrophota bacterium]